jgi:hypothetical protein
MNTLVNDANDPSVPVQLEEKQVMIMGDASGDLGEKMDQADEEGKQERMEEERKEVTMDMQVDEKKVSENGGDKRKRDDDVDMEGTSQSL